MDSPTKYSEKQARAAMKDIAGMKRAARMAGDVAGALRSVQSKGYSADFYEIEEAVDEHIGGLSSAGVILLLMHRLASMEPAHD